jgi:hypothetical protein
MQLDFMDLLAWHSCSCSASHLLKVSMKECLHAIMRGAYASTLSGDRVLQDVALSKMDLKHWQAQQQGDIIVKLLRAGKPENLGVVNVRPVEASAAGITKELSARDVPPLYLVCALLRHYCVIYGCVSEQASLGHGNVSVNCIHLSLTPFKY